MKKIGIVVLILAVTLLSACGGGGSSPSGNLTTATATSVGTPPSGGDISGTWTGRASSSYYGGYINIAWTISQSGTSFSGNYFCSPGTINCISPGGVVSGSIVGNNFTGNIALSGGIACSFIGTMSGSQGNGNYNCDFNADAGTWTMNK
jgi:hypothetical protein